MSGPQIDLVQISAIVLAVLIAVAWYLSYSAARLDRLHAKVEGALSALDAQLVRRAEATLELANSGVLDPASSLLLADAASESLDRQTEHIGDDLLEGQHFAGRESVESDLTEALNLALVDETVVALRADGDLGTDVLRRVGSAALRVQMARRFHNDAVREVRRVRTKAAVRAFRLAGHADLPEPVEFHDELPRSMRP